MSAPETCHFQPGQLVECIDDVKGEGISWSGEVVPLSGPVPIKGLIYTVAFLHEGPMDLMFLGLAELPAESVFHTRFFRPVQTPDIGIFRGLLAPTPASTREVELA